MLPVVPVIKMTSPPWFLPEVAEGMYSGKLELYLATKSSICSTSERMFCAISFGDTKFATNSPRRLIVGFSYTNAVGISRVLTLVHERRPLIMIFLIHVA